MQTYIFENFMNTVRWDYLVFVRFSTEDHTTKKNTSQFTLKTPL